MHIYIAHIKSSSPSLVCSPLARYTWPSAFGSGPGDLNGGTLLVLLAPFPRPRVHDASAPGQARGGGTFFPLAPLPSALSPPIQGTDPQLSLFQTPTPSLSLTAQARSGSSRRACAWPTPSQRAGTAAARASARAASPRSSAPCTPPTSRSTRTRRCCCRIWTWPCATCPRPSTRPRLSRKPWCVCRLTVSPPLPFARHPPLTTDPLTRIPRNPSPLPTRWVRAGCSTEIRRCAARPRTACSR